MLRLPDSPPLLFFRWWIRTKFPFSAMALLDYLCLKTLLVTCITTLKIIYLPIFWRHIYSYQFYTLLWHVKECPFVMFECNLFWNELWVHIKNIYWCGIISFRRLVDNIHLILKILISGEDVLYNKFVSLIFSTPTSTQWWKTLCLSQLWCQLQHKRKFKATCQIPQWWKTLAVYSVWISFHRKEVS